MHPLKNLLSYSKILGKQEGPLGLKNVQLHTDAKKI